MDIGEMKQRIEFMVEENVSDDNPIEVIVK